MKRSAVFLALLALSGCSAAQLSQAVVDGQLFCAMATSAGSPITVAVQNALNSTPILAKNNTAAYVQTICGLIGAVPVSPPAVTSGTPVISVDPTVAIKKSRDISRSN